jgi:L-threonylcarbamoyladenylate synthase
VIISQDIHQALKVLQNGGLVGLPTETVYGLGADALNINAVKKIFAAKGRPADHPLIVHIGSVEEIMFWAENIPDEAWTLAKHFWPGPMTLILNKKSHVPDIVTGGQKTIGLRVPNHPMALELLKKFGGGIAAPSANRFTKVSPTTAQHVADDLKDTVDIILDGGACEVGIESTIIDLSSKNISILRPGAVTAEDLKKVLGFDVPLTTKSEIKVPGQHEVHYSPQAKIILAQESEIAELTKKLQKENLKNIKVWKSDQNNLNEMAKELYQQFRNADETKLDALIVIPPPHSGIGIAINDRLKRAAKK